ncbi:MAG TPA: HAD-IB family phosphatase [Longimicrobiales bacterium]|nr:HAD-IB family phosphatase [Longimicrobiales bacterium]
MSTPEPAYRSVIFDCDSTLSTLEGIEELAADHREEVAALTASAMRGEVPLEAVYGQRLELIQPTRAAVEGIVSLYIETVVEDAAAVVAGLQVAGVEVRVISGGLLPAVAGLARHLGVPEHLVAAVPIHFSDDGAYAGFDAQAHAARAGGKAEVVRAWKTDPDHPLPGPTILVGDGATDLEAAEEVDLFVAYAGVVARPNVTRAAPAVLRSRSLAPILPLAVGDRWPDHGAPGNAFRTLLRRGEALIRDGALQWNQ